MFTINELILKHFWTLRYNIVCLMDNSGPIFPYISIVSTQLIFKHALYNNCLQLKSNHGSREATSQPIVPQLLPYSKLYQKD